MNKKDLQRLNQIKKGEVKEIDGWITINATTNKHSFLFNTLACRLEQGDETDLWHKID